MIGFVGWLSCCFLSLCLGLLASFIEFISSMNSNYGMVGYKFSAQSTQSKERVNQLMNKQRQVNLISLVVGGARLLSLRNKGRQRSCNEMNCEIHGMECCCARGRAPSHNPQQSTNQPPPFIQFLHFVPELNSFGWFLWFVAIELKITRIL